MKLLFRDQRSLRWERVISRKSSERWQLALNLTGALGDAAGLYGGLLLFAGFALYLLNLLSPVLAIIGAFALVILLAIVGLLFTVILMKNLLQGRLGQLYIDELAHGFIVVSTSGLVIWLITDVLLSSL